VDLVLKQLLNVKPNRVEIPLQEACDYNKKVLKRIIPCCGIDGCKDDAKSVRGKMSGGARRSIGSQSLSPRECHIL
jgi:hypothetical protein